MFNNYEDSGKFEFSANTEQYLSYLFLQDFQMRYQQLMNALGAYISHYDKFHSNFLSEEERQQKRVTVATIKANLAPVVYMLEAINNDTKNSTATVHIEKLKDIHKKIIQTEDIALDDLENINYHLSFVVSILFLRPVMQKLPAKSNRIYGSVDVED